MSNYNPNKLREELEAYLLRCKINYESPYSSGFEISYFGAEIKKTEAKLKKVGRQLKFKFE